MTTLSISVPDTAFSALHLDPEGFAREMRSAAAIQWYAQARVSQDKAARLDYRCEAARAGFGRRRLVAVRDGDSRDVAGRR